jgi:hypothetical protein
MDRLDMWNKPIGDLGQIQYSASPEMIWLEFGNQLFGFLNKVEWLIALLIILSLVMFKDVIRARNIWFFSNLSF